MKDKNHLIDKLVNQKLGNYEEPYNENAWLHMKKLLEKNKETPVVPIHLNNKTNKQNNKIIGMISLSILTTISALGIWHVSSKQTNTTIEKNNSTIKETVNTNVKQGFNIKAKENKIHNSIKKKVLITNKNNKATNDLGVEKFSNLKNVTKQIKSNKTSKVKSNTTKSLNDFKFNRNSNVKNKNSLGVKTASAILKPNHTNATTLGPIDTLQLLKAYMAKLLENKQLPNSEVRIKKVVLSKEVWVNSPKYEYKYLNSRQGPIKEGWIGIYYTQQKLGKSWDSAAHGFNFQFMSGNLKNWKKVAVYGGFDWGMLFYGSSKRTQIAINTLNKDSGYTFLRSNAMDLMFKTHLEYHTPRFSPYLSLSVGPRLFYTRQRTDAYMKFKEYESGSSNTVMFNASLIAGVGLGIRVPVYKRISLDARLDYYVGTKTRVANLQTSSFNGLEYRLNKISLNPQNAQFKIGVVIDLSEKEYTKTLVSEGYTKTQLYDSMLIEQKGDSSIIKIECNCDCDKKKENDVEKYPYTPNEDQKLDKIEVTPEEEKKLKFLELLKVLENDENGSGGNNGSSGSSGSGKKSFPGTTKPTPSTKRH